MNDDWDIFDDFIISEMMKEDDEEYLQIRSQKGSAPKATGLGIGCFIPVAIFLFVLFILIISS